MNYNTSLLGLQPPGPAAPLQPEEAGRLGPQGRMPTQKRHTCNGKPTEWVLLLPPAALCSSC